MLDYWCRPLCRLRVCPGLGQVKPMRVPPYRARASGRRLSGNGQQRWEEEEGLRAMRQVERQVACVEGWELDHPGHQLDRQPRGWCTGLLAPSPGPEAEVAAPEGPQGRWVTGHDLLLPPGPECCFAAVEELERAWRVPAPGRLLRCAMLAAPTPCPQRSNIRGPSGGTSRS